MLSTRSRDLTSIALFLAFSSTATIARAQSAPSTAATEVSTGDIIVTAQKRGELLSKVPIAISAVSSASLENSRVVGITDLGSVVPGLNTATAANASTFWLPFIRGVGSNATGLGNNSSVATYIDGIYQPANTTNVQDFANIERIEVLKGPQGTLFGRNATGGAINIITKKPSDSFELNAEGSYGRFGETVDKFYVTGPLGPTLAASLSYQYHGGGNYIRDLSTDKKFGGFNNHSLNGKLLWNPSDRLEIGLSLIYAKHRQTDPSQSLAFAPEAGLPPIGQLGVPINFEPRKFLGNRPFSMESSKKEAQLNLKYSFDSFDLVSLTGYQRADNQVYLDFDATTVNGFYFAEVDHIKSFSQEVQLVSNGTGPLKWILGLFYSSDIQSYAPLYFGIGVPFPATPEVVAANAPGGTRIDINSTSNAKSYAAFAQGTYALGDKTNLTLGLRYTIEDRSLNGTQAVQIPTPDANGRLFFTPFVIDASPANNKTTFKKPSWRISLDHNFSDELMAYVSYNRGFKSGVYNATSVSQKAVNPEILDAYEVGAKARLLDGKLSLNAAAFYYDYKNLQVQVTQTGTILLENAAAATLYGGEVEAVFRPSHALVFHAGLSLLHSEYKDYFDAATFILNSSAGGENAIIPDASGQRLIYAPKYTYNIGVEHTLDMSGGSSVVSTVNWSYSGGYKTVVGGDGNFIRAYGTLAAALTWFSPDKTFHVGVFGQNLTDKEDIGRYLNTAGLERQLQRPRTFGVLAGVKFK
jgi:iron complex outermembrane recepter protein